MDAWGDGRGGGRGPHGPSPLYPLLAYRYTSEELKTILVWRVALITTHFQFLGLDVASAHWICFLHLWKGGMIFSQIRSVLWYYCFDKAPSGMSIQLVNTKLTPSHLVYIPYRQYEHCYSNLHQYDIWKDERVKCDISIYTTTEEWRESHQSKSKPSS